MKLSKSYITETTLLSYHDAIKSIKVSLALQLFPCEGESLICELCKEGYLGVWESALLEEVLWMRIEIPYPMFLPIGVRNGRGPWGEIPRDRYQAIMLNLNAEFLSQEGYS